MSDEEKNHSPDATNSEDESKNMALSDIERDFVDVNQPFECGAPEFKNQDDVRNGEDLTSNVSSDTKVDVTYVFEIEELPSEESSERSSSDGGEKFKILYEFPDNSETCEVTNSENQKRQMDDKNESAAKKSRSESADNTGLSPKEETGKKSGKLSSNKCIRHYSPYDKATKVNNLNRNNKYVSETGANKDHLHILKPVSCTSKSTDNEQQCNVKPYTNLTESKEAMLATDSASDGALADIEDNAENSDPSEEIFSDGYGKHPERLNSSSSNGEASGLNDQHDGSNKTSSSPCVDIDNGKQSLLDEDNFASRNEAEAGNKSPRMEKDPNTPQISSNNKSEASSSSTANQLKMKSDVLRRNKRRCFSCNKKLGLTAITCRCGGLFCANHRYDKAHGCTFDYKAMGAEEIRKNNPQVIAEKVKKL